MPEEVLLRMPTNGKNYTRENGEIEGGGREMRRSFLVLGWNDDRTRKNVRN